MQDPTWASAADLGREIEAGRLDPRELTETFLAAIEAEPKADAIYARVMAPEARAAAAGAASRARDGLRLGPLDGVPVSWKDLFDTAGIPTEGGSRLLAGRLPDQDAVVVAHGAAAGLVPLGKTHLSELAFSGLGINPVTATSPNPHGEGLAPGGSSSGAAASLSFGLAAAAVGSDTGGSVRIPAAWHDLVGLKTTWGLVPLDGTIPLVPSLDTIGPLTRNVEDAALMHAILSGSKPPRLEADLSEARFIVESGSMAVDLEPAISTGFEETLRKLAAAGATIEHRALRTASKALEKAWTVAVEAYAVWGEEIEARPDAVFPMIRQRFQGGRGQDAVAYQRALFALKDIQLEWLAETNGYDAILSPTTPITAPPVEGLMTEEEFYVERNVMALRNTRVGNMLGLSALTLPTQRPMVGLMLTAAPFAEDRLLALGAAIERALG